MEDIRKGNGIPNIKNGEHKILQMQINSLHTDIKYIKKGIDKLVPDTASNTTRSELNFKLICIIFVGMVTLAGGVIASFIPYA